MLSIDRLQVSAWNGTDISVGDVPANLVGGWPSSPAFSRPWTTAHRSSLQTHDSWQKGILLLWPVCMEQSSWIPQRRIACPEFI